MDERAKSWIRGCAAGCAGLVFLMVAIMVGLTMSVMRPLDQAIESRQELESRVGSEDDFTPPADGSVPADRVESFLEVRESLQGVCAEITRKTADLVALEKFDGVDDPPRREILFQSMKATKSAMGLGPALGELHNRRNLALLDVEMGLGEYSYIYVMAYHDQMVDPGERTGIMDGPTVSRRMHDVLAEMLARQLQQAEDLAADQRVALETEIEAMAAEDRRVPWQDGLPVSIAASFAPFRDQLDEAFCPAMTEMELLKATRRKFGIESE